jgi:copper/silver efflux system protein
MINWLIDVSLRNRLLVIAFFLLIGGWGYWALLTTPIDAIPDLSDNPVIVFTDWTGRSPQEVEDQITYPLTVILQGLPGVRVVRSSSAFGFSIDVRSALSVSASGKAPSRPSTRTSS